MSRKFYLLMFAFSAAGTAGALSLASNDTDALFFDRTMVNASVDATGDYNGDGYKDIVIYWDVGSPTPSSTLREWHARLIYGGPSVAGGDVEEKASVRILVTGRHRPQFWSADIDQDDRSDIVLVSEGADGHLRAEVYYGGPLLGPDLDSAQDPPDWTALTPTGGQFSTFIPSFAVGDVTGDGRTDFLVGSDAGAFYLIPGASERRLGAFDVSAVEGVHTFLFPQGREPRKVFVGQLDADSKLDIVFQSLGAASIVHGSSSLPVLWDFATRSPDVALVKDGNPFDAAWLGDVDGDGVDDLYLENAYPDPEDPTYSVIDVLVPGTNLNGDFPVVDLRKTSSNYRPIVEVLRRRLYDGFRLTGDFDGDGRSDPAAAAGDELRLWLSNNIATLATATLSDPSLTVSAVYGTVRSASLGDVNGDGFDDLVSVESGSTGTHWFPVIYGFQPLENPSIRFRERGPSPAERRADLSVEGDPVDMWLDGDGIPAFMNRWVPFQSTLRLDLSPGSGARTVGVIFRNRYGRRSDRAEDTVNLAAEDGGHEPLTTVLRRGGAPIRLECRLPSDDRLKVWVTDRLGRTVATLSDEVRGAGLWPVGWDGRSASGGSVGPGIYFCYIETSAGRERRSLVVQ